MGEWAGHGGGGGARHALLVELLWQHPTSRYSINHSIIASFRLFCRIFGWPGGQGHRVWRTICTSSYSLLDTLHHFLSFFLPSDSPFCVNRKVTGSRGEGRGSESLDIVHSRGTGTFMLLKHKYVHSESGALGTLFHTPRQTNFWILASQDFQVLVHAQVIESPNKRERGVGRGWWWWWWGWVGGWALSLSLFSLGKQSSTMFVL